MSSYINNWAPRSKSQGLNCLATQTGLPVGRAPLIACQLWVFPPWSDIDLLLDCGLGGLIITVVSGADPVNTRSVTGNSRTFGSKPGHFSKLERAHRDTPSTEGPSGLACVPSHDPIENKPAVWL